MIKDNICAIATYLQTASVSVIRVSGPTAIEEVNRCFSTNILEAKANTLVYGYIKDEDEIIDEVMISVFRAPKSFTMENVCEITTHGGVFVTKKVLETLLKQDIRIANPGEFTYRAYLNGRIDLVQAEAIKDIIDAKSNYDLKISFNALKSHTSKLVSNLSSKILNILTQIEVNIEYPEYEDIDVLTNDELLPLLIDVKTKIKEIIIHSNNTKLIKDGIKTVIIGRPNVGKSSILNALLNEEKAIVTNIKGTTRDIVEGSIVLNNNIKLNLIDTAGIRKTEDKIERIGVRKSLKALKEADLIFLILNTNQKLTKEDLDLLDKTKKLPRIIIGNKTDLKKRINFDDYLEFSAKTKEGITKLEEKIIDTLNLVEIKDNDYKYLSNIRQISLLNDCLKNIENAIINIKKQIPIDLIGIDIKQAYQNLEEILGNVYDEDIPKNIFKNYCLGK